MEIRENLLAPFVGKLGYFISDEEYARRLNAAVKSFQRKVQTIFSTKRRNNVHAGELKQLYELIVSHGETPLTRDMIMRELYPDYHEIDSYTWSHLNHKIHSRLQMLKERGLLEACGRIPHPDYIRSDGRSSMSYRAVKEPDLPKFRRARAELYKQLEHLNHLR